MPAPAERDLEALSLGGPDQLLGLLLGGHQTTRQSRIASVVITATRAATTTITAALPMLDLSGGREPGRVGGVEDLLLGF